MNFLASADRNAQPWRMPLSEEASEQIEAVRTQQRQQRRKAAEKVKVKDKDGKETADDASATAAAAADVCGAEEIVREMQKAFAVVFVDSSGVTNLAGRVSDSGWAELQREVSTSEW